MKYNIYENGGAVEGLVTVGGLAVTNFITLRADPIERLEIATKEYVDYLADNAGTTRIVSGIFNRDRMPSFSGQVSSLANSGILTLQNIGVTPGTYTKIAVATNGLITAGGFLSYTDIPSLNWDKIQTNRPTTYSGYGITDTVNKLNGSIDGVLTLLQGPLDGLDVATKEYVDNRPLNHKNYEPGDIIVLNDSVTPTGFLKANGGEISKATYAVLYAVIGDQFSDSGSSDLSVGAGKPWKRQYEFNTEQSSDITGWTTDTSLPDGLSWSQAIVTKNRVYLLGGNSADGIMSTVYTAPINEDGTLGTWSTGPSLPGALVGSQAIVTKNRVYLLGGFTETPLSTVYTAPINSDGTLGAWSTGTSLPGGLGDSQAIVTKNRVYLLGGFTDTSVSTVYTAPINSDGTIGTWTTGTSLPGPLAYSQVIVTKNRVYLLAGFNGDNWVTTVYTAPINSDGTLGAWTTGTNLPGALSNLQAIVTKSRAYLLGGYNDASGTVSTVYTAPINADGTLGTWTTGPSLPGGLEDPQAIVTKNRVYLLGGFNGFETTSTVYTAPFSGGLNDYSSLNDSSPTNSDNFRLPDYTQTNIPSSYVYIKY